MALSARPIVAVGRIWADGNLLRGAAGDWKVATGFRLHPGGEDQAADPLIASAEGAAAAPAHRGIAYVVFEDLPLEQFGNRIPSLTFEVIADDGPVSVGAIAQAVGEGAIDGAGPALLLDGFSAYGDSARGVIETLAEVAGAWFAPTAAGLAMVNDALPSGIVVADQASRRIAPAGQAPRSVVVSHYDPARDWQTGVQRATHPSGDGAVLAVDLPAAVDAGAAKTIAEAMLAGAEVRRTSRRITGDAGAIALTPGAVVSIAGEGGAWRVRSVSVERFTVTAELLPLTPSPVVVAASPGRVLRAPDAPAGATIVHAFELPIPADGGGTQPAVTIAAAGSLPGWRRAALQISLDDGGSWTAIGGTRAPAIIGVLTAAIGSGCATLDDRRNILWVALAHGGMAAWCLAMRMLRRSTRAPTWRWSVTS